MPGRIWEKLLELFAAERERWALWIPVLLGGGIGLYFLLPFEPPAWLGASIALSLLLLGLPFRKNQALLLAFLAMAALAVGFAVAQFRTVLAAAPVLSRPIGPVLVTGRAVEVERQLSGQRVTLDRVMVKGLREAPPERVRVKLPARSAEVRPGELLSLRAVLMPPPMPSYPGAYDFPRQAWFERLGAVGYAYSAKRIEDAPPGGPLDRFALGLAALRHDLTERIVKAIGGEAGAVAAALMTGERSGISAELNEAYRNSGLFHLLSISGLHMAMVAGLAMMFIRRLFALSEFLALGFPIKKWAALAAILVTFSYLLISGAMVPSLRSFLMTALVLLGVMLDRQAISMRLVAWAAAVVLLLAPESLLGPSFQMSFAAVAALVAAYEGPFRRLNESGWSAEGDRPWWRKPLLYVAACLATTIIATLATAPYSLHHFNRLAPYGLPANLLAVPLTGVAVMPFAMLAFLLMPLGLEEWALRPMGWAVEAVNRIAVEVGGWSGAEISLPGPGTGGLIVATLGGLWLCLWRGEWRRLGFVPLLAGMAVAWFHDPPDVMIAPGMSPMAVRTMDGGLLFSREKGNPFAREIWSRRGGGASPAGLWPEGGTSPDGALACDSWGCLYRRNGKSLAFVRSPEALAEDCRKADLVVSLLPLSRRSCPGDGPRIGRSDLLRHGSHLLWLRPEGIRIKTVAEERGNRPWSFTPPTFQPQAPK